MDVTVKAFLAKSDGSTEVRRLPLTLVGPSTISGLFQRLKSQIAGSFPDLKDTSFIISWRDSDGDYVLVSSDDELLEALSEMENLQLKLYLTEAPSDIQPDAIAAQFPGKTRRERPRGPWMRISESEKTDLSVKDDKGWKTALRDLVPTAHRRWAKEHIRAWRQEHLDNGSVTGSSDGEVRGQKITAEEAGVPQEYPTYLDIQVFRFHKVWAQEKPGKVQAEFEKAKDLVPEPFQNWVRWYLKKTFGPNRTPHFKKIKDKKEEKAAKTEQDKKDKKKKEDEKLKKEAKAWKKEWKERLKEMREAVPKEQRVWSKSYISWWRQESLTQTERARYATTSSSSSSSSSESSEETKQKVISKPDLTAVPENYPRWLNLFLTQWHACQGDSLPEEDVKKASVELKEIDDEQVPREYRKWARFYIIRVLCRRKKYRQQSNEVNTWRQYHLWLVEFQKRWVADQDAASNSEGEDVPESQGEPRGGMVVQKLQAILDSETEYDLEMPVPPTCRPPADFRYWALDIIQKWDGQTIGQGLPDTSAAPLDNETKDIPPGVLHWLMKVTARSQLKKLRKELRGAAGDEAKSGKNDDGKRKFFFGKKKDSDESDKKKKAETDGDGKKKKDGGESDKKKKGDTDADGKKKKEHDGGAKSEEKDSKGKKVSKHEEKKKKSDSGSDEKREEENDGEGKGKDSSKKKKDKEETSKKKGEKDDKKKKSEKEEKAKSEANQDSAAKKKEKKDEERTKGDGGDRKKKDVKTDDKVKDEDRSDQKEPKEKKEKDAEASA